MAGKRERANGEGTVYQDTTRDKKWVAQKYVTALDGRVKRITARGRTKRDALDALRLRERTVAASSMSGERTTVEQFINRWLEHKEATVKARTARDYRQVLTTHALPVVGHLPLAKVRPAHLQVVVDRLAKRGAVATAFNARRYLQQAFGAAVQWEYIARNPVDGVSRVDVPTPKRGLWSVEQTTLFLTFSRDRTSYYPLFLAAVVTGLRQGELVALPWSNVTPEFVRVDRTWSKDEVVGYDTPKTRHAYRDVPISAEVYRVLERRRRQVPSALAFPTNAGTMNTPWNVHRAFVAAIKAVNVRDKDDADQSERLPRVRFHDLRRVAATLWARQGAEPKVIQQLLGHSTPHLALSVYQGVLDERVSAARLDARMLFGGYAVFDDGHSGVVADAPSDVLDRPLN